MSRPVLQRVCAAIEREALEAGMSPEELMLGRYIAGESPKKLMARYGVSRDMWYTWLGMDPSGRRRKLYDEAKRLSADAHADISGEVLEDVGDGLTLTSAQVSLANSKSAYHRWLAEVRDRDQYGTKQAPTVQINLGLDHLTALRELGCDPGRVVDAEIVEDVPALPSPSQAILTPASDELDALLAELSA
jgi:hypothetical protein